MSTELIALLDAADSLPGVAELRARSYDLLDPVPDARVVDVGCGAGRAVAELCERGIDAVGVDVSDPTIAVARQRWRGADFRVGDAYRLPLADGEVAGYRADKVYHELGRSYRNLLLDHGFTDVTVEVRTAVFTDAKMLPMLAGLANGNADAWLAEQTRRAEEARLFLAIPMFVAAATID